MAESDIAAVRWVVARVILPIVAVVVVPLMLFGLALTGDLTSSALRRLALRQALMSYLFGAVILAMTINVTAGFIL